ncbi:MAG: NIPSNAP family protein [Chloroflexota bacterium]|nr:NIPSNAP family protein [Chloroflexota bacterium]
MAVQGTAVAAGPPAGVGEGSCCPVVELRQYRLRPRARDTLVEIFERAALDGQEAVGMEVVGQFRDLDDPDRFVFVRGFPGMAERAAALRAFYDDGPVWAAIRDEANATMAAWDDVRLLRPAFPGSGFAPGGEQPTPGAADAPAGLVVATVYPLAEPADDGFAAFFAGELAPALAASGADILATFATEPSPNTYPLLPVREGEEVFVWFGRFADRAAYDRHVAALAGSRGWQEGLAAELARFLEAPPEVRLMAPTPRSRLR